MVSVESQCVDIRIVMHFVFTTAIVSVASSAKFNGSIKAYGLYIIIGQIQMVASKPMDYILQNATKAYGLYIFIHDRPWGSYDTS